MATEAVNASGKRTRGRTRINRELIIASGLELAARPGVDSLRIRDLGKELGIDPSAVYRHFQNKNELMTALVEAVGEQTLALVDTSPERDWREVLTDISEATLKLYLEYPIVGADGAAFVTESIEIVEQILAAFARGGLEGEALVRHYTLFASYLLSFSGAIARSRIEYGDEIAERPWVEDVRVATAATHPTANVYREDILAMRDIDVFRSSIRLVLDSAAAAAGPAR